MKIVTKETRNNTIKIKIKFGSCKTIEKVLNHLVASITVIIHKLCKEAADENMSAAKLERMVYGSLAAIFTEKAKGEIDG